MSLSSLGAAAAAGVVPVSSAPGEIICRCLYCHQVTAVRRRQEYEAESEKATVCHPCSWSSRRDEALEVAAGMRPWMKRI